MAITKQAGLACRLVTTQRMGYMDNNWVSTDIYDVDSNGFASKVESEPLNALLKENVAVVYDGDKDALLLERYARRGARYVAWGLLGLFLGSALGGVIVYNISSKEAETALKLALLTSIILMPILMLVLDYLINTIDKAQIADKQAALNRLAVTHRRSLEGYVLNLAKNRTISKELGLRLAEDNKTIEDFKVSAWQSKRRSVSDSMTLEAIVSDGVDAAKLVVNLDFFNLYRGLSVSSYSISQARTPTTPKIEMTEKELAKSIIKQITLVIEGEAEDDLSIRYDTDNEKTFVSFKLSPTLAVCVEMQTAMARDIENKSLSIASSGKVLSVTVKNTITKQEEVHRSHDIAKIEDIMNFLLSNHDFY